METISRYVGIDFIVRARTFDGLAYYIVSFTYFIRKY